VPPRWEREGPMVQRFIDTLREVLTQPAQFFRSMARTGGLGPPLIFALIGVAIGSVGSYLTQMMMPFGVPGASGSGGFVAFAIMVPAIALCSLFIGSGLLHLLLLLIAGTKQPFETSFRTFAYTMGSIWPLSIIPFIGGIIGAVWGLIVLILGTAESHEVTQAQAAIAVLLPSVICCGIAILFGGAMLALLFGAAAAGMR
jgi:hypothetical protein